MRKGVWTRARRAGARDSRWVVREGGGRGSPSSYHCHGNGQVPLVVKLSPSENGGN